MQTVKTIEGFQNIIKTNMDNIDFPNIKITYSEKVPFTFGLSLNDLEGIILSIKAEPVLPPIEET